MTTISAAEYVRDPYPFLAAHRAAHPVSYVDLFHHGPVWLVTGHPEADALLKDHRFVRDSRAFGGVEAVTIADVVRRATDVKWRTFMLRDGAFHARVRGLVHRGFTRAIVAQLRPLVERIAGGLIDEMRGRRSHDLLAAFAARLPLWVICDLLGMPRDDWQTARRFSDAYLRFIDLHTTAEDHVAAAAVMLEAERYFLTLVDERRRAPKADVISRLAAETGGTASISDEEIAATCLLLITAGHETTMNLIGTGYWLLLSRPDQYAMLRRNAALIPNAVEEMLRYEPGVFSVGRWVAEDMEFFGQPLRRGQFAVVALGAANRDPRVNPEPDRFDIGRARMKHLTFAAGVHFCVGAHLARLEGHIALGLLVNRLVRPRLAAEPRWANRVAVRGFEALHVEADVR
jgi:cytochrome P450